MNRENSGCFTDCTAIILKLDSSKVPFFVEYGKDYLKHVKRFYKKHGYTITPKRFQYNQLSNKRKLYLLQGLSPRSKYKGRNPYHGRAIQHAVIYKGRTPFYDSNPSGKFLKGKPYWLWEITKIR